MTSWPPYWSETHAHCHGHIHTTVQIWQKVAPKYIFTWNKIDSISFGITLFFNRHKFITNKEQVTDKNKVWNTHYNLLQIILHSLPNTLNMFFYLNYKNYSLSESIHIALSDLVFISPWCKSWYMSLLLKTTLLLQRFPAPAEDGWFDCRAWV